MTAEALAAFVRGSVNMRQPVRGDRVTVCDQPRNTDFLQAGQVGTVVDIDDMDVEDVWFTVEDADGETDEYCEADLVIAATSRTAVAKGDAVDESHLKVATLAAARGHERSRLALLAAAAREDRPNCGAQSRMLRLLGGAHSGSTTQVCQHTLSTDTVILTPA